MMERPKAASPMRHAMSIAVGVGFLWIVELAFEIALGGRGGPVPAMLAVFSLLAVLRVVRPVLAETLVQWLRPSVRFLLDWMPLFFAPALVALPAIPLPDQDVLGRLAVMLVGGFAVTLGLMAGLSATIDRLVPARRPERADAMQAPRLPGRAALLAWTVLALMGLAAVRWLKVRDPTAVAPFLVAASVTAYVAGLQLSSRLGSWLHPVVTCAIGTHLFLAVMPIELDVYITRDFGQPGAGDLLLGFLGPAVLALAFQLDEHRATLRRHLAQLVIPIGILSVITLLGQAAAARALGLSAGWTLALVPRFVTMPIALPMAHQVGADLAVTGGAVVLTGMMGAIAGRKVLDLLGVASPVARGLAIGVASHGLGTASLVGNEPGAGAIAAVTFALFATASALALAIPPIEGAIHWLAGG